MISAVFAAASQDFKSFALPRTGMTVNVRADRATKVYFLLAVISSPLLPIEQVRKQ
jgi:hypothetical protein